MSHVKGRLIKDGGEGYIYEVGGNPGLYMKMYKKEDHAGEPIITAELVGKLVYMLSNPPTTLIENRVIAWPIELVYENGNIAGFVMPKMDMHEHIQRVYSYRHPTLDSTEYAKFPSIKSRISIAVNLCSALHELHRKGYVFGDFNHANVGVNYSTGQIYFVDCDSFHITDDYGNVFRTNVIMAGYLAPEIIAHCNNERSVGRYYNLDKVSLPTFTRESDLFCLAVHIFKLLMNGVDPFRGVRSDSYGSTASPFVGNDAIERNAYVFRPGNMPSAVFCPPAQSLPPEIFSMFNRAFVDGRAEPLVRPSAEEWYHALTRFLVNDLAQCPNDNKHQYYRYLHECPYCEADYRHLVAQGGAPEPQPQPYVEEPYYSSEDFSGPRLGAKKSRAPGIIAAVILILLTSIIVIALISSLGRSTTTTTPPPPAAATAVNDPFAPFDNLPPDRQPYSETVYNDDGSYREIDFAEDGRVVRETWYNPSGLVSWVQEHEYYSDGHNIWMSGFDEQGLRLWWEKHEYDLAGNLIYITEYRPDGSMSWMMERSYDADGYTEWYLEYDENGNMRSYTNSRYNINGYCLWVDRYDSGGAPVGSSNYEYDNSGRVTYEIHNDNDSVWQYEYEYDINGRMISRTENDNGSVWRNEYEYDLNDNVVGKKLHAPDGMTYSYEYDENGNVIKEVYYNPDGTVNYEWP